MPLLAPVNTTVLGPPAPSATFGPASSAASAAPAVVIPNPTRVMRLSVVALLLLLLLLLLGESLSLLVPENVRVTELRAGLLGKMGRTGDGHNKIGKQNIELVKKSGGRGQR